MKSKHARYRAKIKRLAIAFMGGKCVRCGFDDERALQFDHVKPARRGRVGLSKSSETGVATHLAIVRGKAKHYQLLCANCHAIKSKQDDAEGWMSVNLSLVAPCAKAEPKPTTEQMEML